jgi:DNA polymerase-1
MKRVLAIDGQSIARPIWEATGGLNVFNQRIASLQTKFEPSDIYIAWDSSRSIRRERFPAYKAKRKQHPCGYDLAIDKERDWISNHTSARQIEVVGWEADDVLFSISRCTIGDVIIASTDKDLFQAVDYHTAFCRLNFRGKPDAIFNLENIVELSGLSPKGWGDYLALRGDSVDGIPGLPKIGDKRARDILSACPDFVNLVISRKYDAARAQCSTNATIARSCETAIIRRDELELSKWLVDLHMCWEPEF